MLIVQLNFREQYSLKGIYFPSGLDTSLGQQAGVFVRLKRKHILPVEVIFAYVPHQRVQTRAGLLPVMMSS